MESIIPGIKSMLQRTLWFFLLVFAGCSSAPTLLPWEPLGAPYAQNVSTLHIGLNTPTTLLAGLTNGDLFKSTNEGSTWILLSSFIRDTRVHRIVQHPDRPSSLFAATDGGLFISHNAGETWGAAIVNRSAPTSACRSVTLDPFDSNVILAGLDGSGLHRSSDGGTSWEPTNGGLAPDGLAKAAVFDIAIDHTSPDIVYAALSVLGVIKSTDRGNSWHSLTPGYASTGTIPTHILISRSEGKVLCFGTASGDLFRSTDGGEHWTPMRRNAPYGSRIVSLTADPTSAQTIYAGTESGVLVSNDFGQSWRRLSAEMPRIPTSLYTARGVSATILYTFGQGTGVQRSSDDGASWKHVDNGLGGAEITHVMADRHGSHLYISTGSSVYAKANTAGPWISSSDGLSGGNIMSLTFDSDSAAILYAATQTEIFKGIDGGRFWIPFAPALRAHPPDFIATHPTITTRMVASGDDGIHVSTDRGQTWVRKTPYGTSHRIRSLAFDASNAAIVYGATSDKGGIASTDGGISWREARYGMADLDILAVTLDQNDDRVCYAWTAHGEGYRTVDGGLSWTRYAPPWGPGDRIFIAADRERPFDVVALVNTGFVYYSSNAGVSWSRIAIEHLRDEVTTLQWNTSTASLYVGTRYSGVYRLSLLRQLRDLRDQ